MSQWGNVWLGKPPLGKCPVGELSSWGSVHQGSICWGSVSWGSVLREVSVRELSSWETVLQSFRHMLVFFYKQLGSGLSPQSSLYFKVFGTQSCLMVAQQFEQVTYVYKKYNNFQDSKSIFMISDFKTFPIMLLRQLNLGVFSV